MKIDFKRMLAHALARRIAAVVVAVILAWCGMGRAEAAEGCVAVSTGQWRCDFKGQAIGFGDVVTVRQVACSQGGTILQQPRTVYVNASNVSVTGHCQYSGGGSIYQGNHSETIVWSDAAFCPVGQTWIASTKTCHDPQQCLARNADLGANRMLPRPSLATERCVAGCKFAMQPGFETETNQSLSDGTTKTVYRGVMEYTGDPCGNVPIDPNWDTPEKNQQPPKQECQQVGTQTMCKKADGQHCASASNGRQVCWKPGETGEKTDGPTLQKKNAGPTEIPPSLSLPNGDTLQKQGDSVKTTTTTNNTTTTTTTTNYTTVNGTNAGTTNQGESATGDGSGQEGGQENGVSGGTTCDSPPVTSGDPVLGSIALQTWKTRCQGEDNKASGAGDCEVSFQCSGEEILCSLAMEKRKERCDAVQLQKDNATALANITAQGDGSEGVDVDGIFHTFGNGDVSEGLFGGGTIGQQCDFSFTMGGQPVMLVDVEWWNVVRLIGGLMVVLAYAWVARQLGG